VQGFGNDPKRRAAATAAYGEELGRALADDADVHQLLDDEPTRPHQIVRETSAPQPAASSSQRAVLEPVSEDAHPVEHVRAATQPHLRAEARAAVASGPRAEPEATIPSLLAPAPITSESPILAHVPEPAIVGPKRSPSPVPVRMGLFSSDRATNLLAGAAIGLLLTIIPAQKLARSLAHDRLNQPLLELKDSIDNPLAVDVGLLRQPKAIAAEIEAGRADVRERYLMIWLLAGLPIGLGIGFIPRWWA
jgi:hypothetical protein